MRAGRLLRGRSRESARLRRLLERATTYLRSHAWCPEAIAERFLGLGVGEVVAVFLFVLDEPVGGSDDRLWVVVGDLPSAYLVADRAPTPRDALAVYCELMERWCGAVEAGAGLADVFPVAAEATAENASALRSRVGFLRRHLLKEGEGARLGE